MSEVVDDSNDMINHRLRNGKFTLTKIQRNHTPQTSSYNGNQESSCQINSETSEKAKGKTDYENLQSVQERELRRSPRGLSKDDVQKSNIQKEIFQKNIKSEVIDLSAYEVSPIKQDKNDVSNNRKQMKIKDCWSPVAKTTEKPGDRTVFTFSNCADETLQSIRERELRRSPRGLSKDSNRKSNFQKAIFQKNIKSEVDDLSSYEVSPIKQNETDASIHREVMKIKDCWSPTVSPHNKTTEKTKEKSDLTYLKFDDKTLQCVREKELRRSPRGLSKDSNIKSNFQKQIFQKNIKSEVDDLSAYGVSPIKQNKTDLLNSRKLMQIKECCSPVNKTTEKAKDGTNFTFSKPGDKNLQCVQERELRRSPRNLLKYSNRKSDFQKEFFQKNIKSEVDDSIVYEASPIQQYETDASNNREVMKIKDCCSPIVSPHDKITERTKEKSDLTFTKSNDGTLQCVPEKELCRSPRALSKDSYLISKFQKSIKSEADDLSACEVNPKKENQINAFSNRGLLKIKDCWSPNTSPKDEIRLLRNGRKLQLTSPSKSKNVQSFKDFDDSTDNIKFIKAENKRGSHHSDCNNKASKLIMYQENSDKDIKTEEMYGPLPRRKKLRSETTDDELWEGLTQKKRVKRLTPKKEIGAVKTDDKHYDNSKSEQNDAMAVERKLLSNSIVPLSNHNKKSTIPPISIEKSAPNISEPEEDTQQRNDPLQKYLIGISPPCHLTDSTHMFDGNILCIKDSFCPDTKKVRVRRNLSKELANSPGVSSNYKTDKINDELVESELANFPGVSSNYKNDKINDELLESELANSPGVSSNYKIDKINDELMESELANSSGVSSNYKNDKMNDELMESELANSPGVSSNYKNDKINDELMESELANSPGVSSNYKNFKINDELMESELANSSGVSSNYKNDKINDELMESELANSPGVSSNYKNDKINDELMESELANSPGVSSNYKIDKINDELMESELANSPGVSSNYKIDKINEELMELELANSPGVSSNYKNDKINDELMESELANSPGVSSNYKIDKINDELMESELANSPGVSSNYKNDKISDELMESELANSPGVLSNYKNDKINDELIESELANSHGVSSNYKIDKINDELMESELANSPGVSSYYKIDKINDELMESELANSPGVSSNYKNYKINDELMESELANSSGVSSNYKNDKINDDLKESELANSPGVSSNYKTDRINDELVAVELANSSDVSTYLKHDKINNDLVELELSISPGVSTNHKNDKINDELMESELANSPGAATNLKNDKIINELMEFELSKSLGFPSNYKNDKINDELVALKLANPHGVSTNLKNEKINDELMELELANSPGVSANLKSNKIHDELVNSKTTKESADTALTESEANTDITDKSVKKSSRIQEDLMKYAIVDEQHEDVLEQEQGDENVSNQTNEQIPRNEIVTKRRSRRVSNEDDSYPMTDNNSSMLLYSVRNSGMTYFTNGVIKKKSGDDLHEQGCNTEFQTEYQPKNINVAKNASTSSVNNDTKVAENSDSLKSNTSFSFDFFGTDNGHYQAVTCFQDIKCDEINRDDKLKRCTLPENDSDFEPRFQYGDDYCSKSLENNMEETICYEMDELSLEILNEGDDTTNQATFQISDRPDANVENVPFQRGADDLTITELIVENTKNATEYVDLCNASGKETDRAVMDDELVEDECDQILKVHREKSVTTARHPNQIVIVTPSKQSARLRDKRTITQSRRLDDYIICNLDQHAKDVSRKHKDASSKYTSIKTNRRKIDYRVDSNFDLDNEITTSEEITCSMQTSSLPLTSNKNDDDFLHNNKISDIKSGEKVDEKSDVDDKMKSKLSYKPAIKLRVQKTQDGFARIISTQPTQLQRLPYVSLSRLDNEQRKCDNNSAGNSCKKRKISQLQIPKSNTSTVEKYRHCASTQRELENRDSETKKSFTSSRRRQRSPNEDIRIMPERSCRRKAESNEELLRNGTIGKHASILWLSENRRHFVQKHSNSSSAEVDAIVTNAWRNLADKEKLRFYLRAKNAMRDENKHSTYKSDNSANGTPNQSVSRKMQKFLCLPPIEQYNELKRWLALVHEVSPGEYAKLIANFKATMKEEKLQRQTCKSQDSSCDSESHHRRSLFQKILDIREKIVDIYHLKKEKQMEFVKEDFDDKVRQLIAGEEVKFPHGVVSQELEQVLSDLKSLENELKVAVSGTPLKSRSYESILENLKKFEQVPSETSDLPSDLLEILEDLPYANSMYAEDLLQETSYCKQIGIDSQSVSAFFNEDVQDTDAVDLALSEDNLKCLSDFFENEARLKISNGNPSGRTSPSQILTNWALADQFRSLATKGTFIDSGSKMLIDPKHLLPFLRGKDIFNARVSQRHAAMQQGVSCTRKTRQSNSTKNNNAVKRIPGVSKYDKYKRTTSKRPMIVHYSRPFKPLNTSFYEHQLQLQLNRKLLQQKEHVSLNPIFNSLRNKPRIVFEQESKAKGRVTLQNEIGERPIVGQESDLENNRSRISPSEKTGDEMPHSQTSPISEYLTRNSKNNITSPFVGRRNYSANTERLNQSSSPSSLSEQKTDSTPNDENESTYPYTHSVIHRRIENVQGRTVVRFTATAFDGRRIS